MSSRFYVLYIPTVEDEKEEMKRLLAEDPNANVFDVEYPLCWVLKDGTWNGAHGPDDLHDVAVFKDLHDTQVWVNALSLKGRKCIVEHNHKASQEYAFVQKVTF